MEVMMDHLYNKLLNKKFAQIDTNTATANAVFGDKNEFIMKLRMMPYGYNVHVCSNNLLVLTKLSSESQIHRVESGPKYPGLCPARPGPVKTFETPTNRQKMNLFYIYRNTGPARSQLCRFRLLLLLHLTTNDI